MGAQMSIEEVETLSRNLGLKLFRTCTKQNLNISELFNELGMEYLRRGGEAGLGVSAVGTMEHHARFSDGEQCINARPVEGVVGGAAATGGKKEDNPNGQKANNSNPGAGANGAAADGGGGGAFKLGGGDLKPSVQRTGGKKRKFDLFSKCSVV